MEWVNIHTHTFRCHHASGTEREYIETAIAAGMKRMGFSDHAPCPFPEGYRSGHRMELEKQQDYFDTLLALKEEYKDQIDIKIGYEMEYYPALFDGFMRFVSTMPVEYLILGQHFLQNEYDITFPRMTTPSDDEERLQVYVDQVIEGMKKGCFTYLAHPDVCDYTGAQAIYDKHFSRLIEFAKANDIPLELNLLGIREHRPYPNERFWQLCSEIGPKVCIGSDAHTPDVMIDSPSLEKALSWVEKYHLNWLPQPPLKKPDFSKYIQQ